MKKLEKSKLEYLTELNILICFNNLGWVTFQGATGLK